MSFHIVIPARMASTRLVNKPLVDIAGKPMIQWVVENALKTQANSVIVATDDRRVVDAVESFGGNACLTRNDHLTGSDRVLEVCEQQNWSDDEVIVNCQGDEPLMPAQTLQQVAELLKNKKAEMATLHKSISEQDAQDPNLVKIVCAQNGRALYFSRAVLPFDRDHSSPNHFGHIGLYAYRVGFLKKFNSYPPCEIEQSERLEQLRALYYGHDIYSQIAIKTPGPGVDTEHDLMKVRALFGSNF